MNLPVEVAKTYQSPSPKAIIHPKPNTVHHDVLIFAINSAAPRVPYIHRPESLNSKIANSLESNGSTSLQGMDPYNLIAGPIESFTSGTQNLLSFSTHDQQP